MVDRLTLTDYAKSEDPDGSQAKILEILDQIHPLIQDMYAKPSNAPLGNRTTVRRGLPTVSKVKINQGVNPSKAITDQVVDAIGMFESRAETDMKIAKVLGFSAFERRRQQDVKAHAEAHMQAIAYDMVYGSILTDEAGFTGAMPRMATLNEGASMIVSQVWSQGTVVGSDGCSILIMDWGDGACEAIFPKNSVSGLDIVDKGEEKVDDADGKPMYAAVTDVNWAIGLAVEDPRHMARIGNIDLSDAFLAAPTQTRGTLVRTLIRVLDMMPDPGSAQRVMYCPVQLYSAFRTQAMDKANLMITLEEYLGKMEPHFMGYPLRRLQAMSITEATVA